MRTVQEDLAQVAQARAYQIGGVLLVMGSGEKPTPCHTVTLERSLLDVEPPAFVARLSIDPRVRCVQVVTPYETHAAFEVGAARDSVVVHHADGELAVSVERLEPQGVTDRSSNLLPGRDPITVIGYSRKYDLGEAIRDALDKIPPPAVGIPDWLSTFTVDSIRVEQGGIAGFDHLAVEVTG